MTQLIIHVEDRKIQFLKALIDEIDGAYILDEKQDDIFTDDVLKMLEERAKSPKEDFITLEEMNTRIKTKYGV